MTASPPRVSVIVPTLNRSALLRQALASIRALEGPDLDIETIVVDNGSTDDTEAVASEFGARFIRASTPGPAAARNAGLRIATGEYLAFLDDDDVWTRDHLRPHLAFLREHPDYAGVVGQVILIDEAVNPARAAWPEAMPADGDLFTAFFEEYPQIGATVVRSSVRDSVGYLDESLIGDEDWDWHLRLALRHRIGFVPVASVLFRARPAGKANEDEVQWTRLRFFWRVFLRNLRRAGKRRPSPWRSLRICLCLTGRYYWYFARSATAHARAGDRRSVRRCLRRAFVASPAHALRGLVLGGEFRAAFGASLPRPFRSRVARSPGD